MSITLETSEWFKHITLVNPCDKDMPHRYVLWFGAYGNHILMVWGRSLDDALGEAIDWIAENEPGLLIDDSVNEEYARLVAEGKSEEEAQEEATVDTTCGGNFGNYIASWEWGIVAEDPSRAEVLALLGRES